MHTWKVCFKINAGKTSVDALFMPLLDRDCTNIWYEYWDNTTQCKALGTVLSHANLTVLTTMARLWVYVGDKKNPFEKLVQPSLVWKRHACMDGPTIRASHILVDAVLTGWLCIAWGMVILSVTLLENGQVPKYWNKRTGLWRSHSERDWFQSDVDCKHWDTVEIQYNMISWEWLPWQVCTRERS